MGDEIFDLGVENEALRDELGEVDEKWLHESKNNKIILWWREKEQVYLRNTKIKSDMCYKYIHYYFDYY